MYFQALKWSVLAPSLAVNGSFESQQEESTGIRSGSHKSRKASGLSVYSHC